MGGGRRTRRTGGHGETGRVVDFPEEESVLSAFLKDITQKADRYADQMFQESERMDPEEVRRLEELIRAPTKRSPPGPHRVRRPWKPEPPPPDLPPQELARTYGKGLKGMRLRAVLVFCWPLQPCFNWLFPQPAFTGCLHWMVISSRSGSLPDCWAWEPSSPWMYSGRASGVPPGRVGMDTLTTLSVLFTLTDAMTLSLSQDREGQLPYAAAALAGLFFLLHGSYHKRCGLRLSCRTAAWAAEPYVLTLDEGKWNGRDTYCKWSGVPNGFGSQIQMDDGAQRIYRVVCPSAAAGLPAVLSAGPPMDSISPSICCGASPPPSPPPRLWRALRMAAPSTSWPGGWPPAARLSGRGSPVQKGDRILTDGDLFPPG